MESTRHTLAYAAYDGSISHVVLMLPDSKTERNFPGWGLPSGRQKVVILPYSAALAKFLTIIISIFSVLMTLFGLILRSMSERHTVRILAFSTSIGLPMKDRLPMLTYSATRLTVVI